MIEQGRGVRTWLPWLGAAAVFVVTLVTARDVLDLPAAALPVVASAAALPFGLIGSLPVAGWVLSAGSALLVSRAYEVVDGDPWPWPVMHGLVLLALLFAVGVRPLPDRGSHAPLPRQAARERPRAVEVLIPAAATVATALLFNASAADDLTAGWTVGAAAVGVGGIVVRQAGLLPRLPAEAPVPPADVPELLLRGAREAFLDLRPVPAARIGGAGTRVAPSWARRYAAWLLAFGVFWLTVSTVEATVEMHPLLVPVVGLVVALPIGLAERYPLVGWRLATALAVVLALAGSPSDAEYPGTWPVVFQWVWLASALVVSIRYERWTTVCVWATSVAAMLTGVPGDSGTVVMLIVAVTAIVVIGDLLRARRSTSRDLARQTELSELEKARRTVLEERARIARELHDVVAHHMSLVVVQAETAPYRLADLPDDAAAEFASISASARQALDEIRGLLGVLRGTDDGVGFAPQPGLDQLEELIRSARRSGASVDLTVSGPVPARISAAVELSAYRIVQESLANAVRHAPGTEVAVDVRYGEGSLELRVANAAPATAAVTQATPGHGLVGMRERATVVGGTLAAGPTGDGGFAVTAVLPYEPPPGTDASPPSEP
ncbi:sensor histidine kinase, partial [Jiangella asiatica]